MRKLCAGAGPQVAVGTGGAGALGRLLPGRAARRRVASRVAEGNPLTSRRLSTIPSASGRAGSEPPMTYREYCELIRQHYRPLHPRLWTLREEIFVPELLR